MRRTLKNRLARLEKQSVAPKLEVLWVDIDSGETHEGVIKARYGDQVPPDVEPITVSWMPQAWLQATGNEKHGETTYERATRTGPGGGTVECSR